MEKRTEVFLCMEALLAHHKVERAQHGNFLRFMCPYLTEYGQGVRYTYEAVNTLIVARR